MKKISLALIAALILAFMLTSCNQYDAVFDSNLNESLFDYKNEESISNASENEIEDNSQNISSVQNSDNANNNYLLNCRTNILLWTHYSKTSLIHLKDITIFLP